MLLTSTSSQSLLEKLQLKDEKNLLIQGLPSSVEKQFVKLSFAKNVTPLLKSRKVDFALVFAVSQKQLQSILNDVIPVLQEDAKFWIAYPKLTSKIASDLSREASWDCVTCHGFETVRSVALDSVWSAIRLKKDVPEKKSTGFSSERPAPGIDYVKRTVKVPGPLQVLLDKNKAAAAFFDSLAFTNKREYVEWIVSAKREDTQNRRLATAMEQLKAGKKTYNEK